MCGIGGILRTDGEPIPEEWLDAIDARIAYRGPDGQGRFRDRVEIETPNGKRIVEIAFVHRRLSIIDHEDGGQPMVSERGRNDSEGIVAVVFNGCIYNHRELRDELESKGHYFVTDHSDTEVLIHGWREWKEELTDHLEGMYAFAIWDRVGATLTLARDLFGEKPLYHGPIYHDRNEVNPCIVFASDARSIIGIGEFEWGEDDPPALVDYATRYLQLGYGWELETPYRQQSVHAVQAGQRVKRKADRGSLDLTPRPLEPHPTDPDAIESLLEQAVQRRLEADVPLGCFLSGGVDSSLVSYFAKKHKPDLRTFSVRMSDERYDESRHAERVATELSTQHTTLEVHPNPAADLVMLINTLGQPFGDSSILPTYWVSNAAREHVKVAISGDGGDEMFVGYERYMAARPLARFHRLLSLLPSESLLGAHPKSRLHKLGRLGVMAREFPSLGVLAMESIFTQPQIDQLMGRFRSQPARYTRDEGGVDDARADLRWCDTQWYLPNDLLTKVDTASMACALEVRCPFLDRDLARAVLAMPIEQLIPGGQRKGFLRQIARKYLPAEIVDRPKMGFAIPIGEWFRDDRLPSGGGSGGGGMKTLLLDHLQAADPFGPIDLNRRAVQRFIDEHMSSKRDHSQRLFTLLTLSIWAKSL